MNDSNEDDGDTSIRMIITKMMLPTYSYYIICSMDTVAPIFFAMGLISAIISHYGWELIGGMASRGKTRPSVVVSPLSVSPRMSSSSSSSHISSSTVSNTASPSSSSSSSSSSSKITSPFSTSSSSSSPRNSGNNNSNNMSNTISSNSGNDSRSWVKSFLYGNHWSVRKSFFLHYYIAGTVSLLFILTYCYYCDSRRFTVVAEASSSSSSTTTTATTIFTPATIALYVLCMIHCIRRSYECYFIHVFSPTAKMHVLFYIIAILYYVFIPAILLDIPLSCGGDIHSNTDRNIRSSSCSRMEYYNYVTSTQSYYRNLVFSSSKSILPITSIVAVTCFGLWAQYQQYRHHCILANLRPKATKTTNIPVPPVMVLNGGSRSANHDTTNGGSHNSSPMLNHNGYEASNSHCTTTTSPTHVNSMNGNSHAPNSTNTNNNTETVNKHLYKVPMGGWFEYVTCPHYFAEVLLYVSYGVLIGMDGRLPNLQRFIAYSKFYVTVETNGTSSVSSQLTTMCYFTFILLWEYRYIITLLFVVLNLQYAAIDNHNWYCMKFDNYSKFRRKTMFPFLY